jgi:hypothetical protein
MGNESVLAALQEQVDGYRKLARLAEAQRRHVQTNQTEQLLDVLQQRQVVLDGIMTAERVVGPAKRAWTETSAKLSPDERTRAERMLQETRQLLEQITSSDRDDAVVLQQRKLALGQQIGKTRAARAVNRQYAAAAYGPRRPNVDLHQ